MKVAPAIGQDFGARLVGQDDVEARRFSQSALAAAAWNDSAVGATVLPSLLIMFGVVSLFCLA